MNVRIRILPLFSLLLVLSACSSAENEKGAFEDLSEKDSLKWANLLLEDLKEEMYSSSVYDSFGNACFTPILPELRNTPKIKIHQDSCFVRERYIKDISEFILRFHRTNQDKNDYKNNFPMYSQITEKQLRSGLDAARQDLAATRKFPNAGSDIITYKKMVVDEWKFKLTALQTLNVRTLKEIHFQAHLILESAESDKRKKDETVRKILEAYYSLRNEDAQKYFGVSYLELYFNHQQTKSKKLQNQLDALELLYPIRICDKAYCRENNIRVWNDYPVCPPPQVEIPIPPAPELEITKEIELHSDSL